MKKIIILLVLLTFYQGNAQCPAPSNLTLSIPDATSAQLSWSENGTATTWEITIIPDFIVGTPLPSDGLYITASNPFLITGLSPANGCNVFFVRSRCSTTDISPWVAVGTLGCDTNVYNYLATLLSNNDFSVINKVKIYPNPTDNILFIDNSEKQIKKIEFFDLQGRLIKTINENKDKYQIDISNLLSATYLVKLSTETGSETVRFVKK